MQTLAIYDMVSSAFAERIQNSDTSSKEAYDSTLEDSIYDLLECVKALRNKYPLMAPILLQSEDSIDEAEIPILIDAISKCSEKRKEMPPLFTGTCFSKVIQKNRMDFPQYIDIATKPHILVKPYADQEWEDFAVKVTKQIILGSLLSLPKGNVRINFVAPSLSNKLGALSRELPTEVYRVFIDKQEIISLSESLTERIKETLRKGSKPELPSYELIVLLDYPYQYDELTENMRILIEQGQQAGIHFIVLNDLRRVLEYEQSFDILSLKDQYFQETEGFYNADEKDYDNTLFRTYSFYDQPALLDACLDYLKDKPEEKSSKDIVNTGQDFVVAEDEISVTIGSNINNREEITLRFNSKDYIHAFILGQSGSGKSVLLNRIITSAINKYSPKDLMLYLLDFKGTEFNRYKGIKHTKAVLVDNSDPQMTLEILRELKEENRRRVKLWQSDGVNNIDSYNRKHPDARVPHILFVADECQVMFSKIDNRHSSYIIQEEVQSILNTIAAQGRSQGIHLLLATQTLADTDISDKIKANLTECFLLDCTASDSNILVPNSSDLTGKQPPLQFCYYHKKELVSQVKTTYADENELESAINASQIKSSNFTTNGGTYFCGSEMFWLDEEEKTAIIQASTKFPIAAIGHNIGLKGDITAIKFHSDFSDNILFFGINKDEQTVGVMINALMSLIISYQQLGETCDFVIIDCLNNEEARYRSLLEAMESEGICRIVERTQSGTLFMQLVNDICNHCTRPTVLGIIGSNQFVEMKRNTPLPSSQIQESESDIEVLGLDYNAMPDLFPNNSLDSSRIKTYPEALMFILDEGPLQDIHVLLQVDKPENILFNGEWCPEVTDKFRHKVILRSENKYLAPMRFSVDIDVETLNEEEEHLRAYYYPENGEPQLFTPYVMPKSKKIINTLTIKTTITWEQQIVQ